MKTLFVEQEINYTGEQLQSLWAFKQFGLPGDSIVAFIGACNISPDYMVDIADLKEGAKIYSPRMLHFIVEHFDMDLERAILCQRLLMCIIKDELNNQLGKNQIQRRGDNLYDGNKKLSITIATLSPVSSMIHVGINISSKGTPIETIGLEDYRVKPGEFAHTILDKYAQEIENVKLIRCKVRGVK